MELGSYKNLLLDRCFSVGVRGGRGGGSESRKTEQLLNVRDSMSEEIVLY